MRGIILAGGVGRRLHPLTLVTNKHLLPVGNQPMIDHPIRILKEVGIRDIMVVTGVEHAGDVFSYCGSGERFGVNFNFAIQDYSDGIAGALRLCETWSGDNPVFVVLGDNIFEHVPTPNNDDTCAIYVKRVSSPERFGVCQYGDGVLKRVVEKPDIAPSPWVVTGCYLFPPDVWGVLRELKPSLRGEFEVTDVINHYIDDGSVTVHQVDGYWSDAGTPESYEAANVWAWENIK